MVKTVPVTFTVSKARPVDSMVLFAMVDVEVQIAGVSFDILGIQTCRLPKGGTLMFLSTFKDEDGIWRPATRVPDKVGSPLAATALTFLVEQGLARGKFE